MALTSDEQELLDVAKAALPSWFTDNERAQEDLAMFAKIMGPTLAQAKDWFSKALILTAAGATSTEPDWLNQHARDRGTSRQKDETDATLRYRLRNVSDSVNPASLLASVNKILFDAGQTVPASMLEFPRDGAFFESIVGMDQQTNGGVFSGPASGTMTFTPTTRFLYPPWQKTAEPSNTVSSTPPDLLWSSVPAAPDTWNTPPVGTPALPVKPGRVRVHQIVISSAASGGNNGTFAITGMAGSGVKYTNVSGVAGTDLTAHWKTQRKNQAGVVIESKSLCYMSDAGSGDQYADRFGRRGGSVLIIVPYVASSSTREALRKAILEMLRQKKGAGIVAIVEARANP